MILLLIQRLACVRLFLSFRFSLAMNAVDNINHTFYDCPKCNRDDYESNSKFQSAIRVSFLSFHGVNKRNARILLIALHCSKELMYRSFANGII